MNISKDTLLRDGYQYDSKSGIFEKFITGSSEEFDLKDVFVHVVLCEESTLAIVRIKSMLGGQLDGRVDTMDGLHKLINDYCPPH